MSTAGALLEQAAALSPWEAAAVVLSIAYLLLAAREHLACWPCALASTLIYTVLFWNVSLLMESALNVYYMGMAVYGWVAWRRGGRGGAPLPVTTWSARRHAAVIATVLALAAVSGALLDGWTSASWPYLDSFTTWGALVTTWMVARKILENWIYWFFIDAVSIPLYLDRGLYLTAALFAAFLVIVVFGYLNWLRDYRGANRVGAAA